MKRNFFTSNLTFVRSRLIFLASMYSQLIPEHVKKKPNFPGYLFIRADLDLIGTSTVKRTPGALRVVDFGGHLASILDDILEKVRDHVERVNELGKGKNEQFKSGDTVNIQSDLLPATTQYSTHISRGMNVSAYCCKCSGTADSSGAF